jgi:hypothetical protein
VPAAAQAEVAGQVLEEAVVVAVAEEVAPRRAEVALLVVALLAAVPRVADVVRRRAHLPDPILSAAVDRLPAPQAAAVSLRA